MNDTTIKKVQSATSPRTADGQRYLASGTKLSMRMWEKEADDDKSASVREYETVGFVLGGKANLEIEGQTVILEAGDSWVVPAGAEHRYSIVEPFTAVEATTPPSQVHDRQ